MHEGHGYSGGEDREEFGEYKQKLTEWVERKANDINQQDAAASETL